MELTREIREAAQKYADAVKRAQKASDLVVKAEEERSSFRRELSGPTTAFAYCNPIYAFAGACLKQSAAEPWISESGNSRDRANVVFPPETPESLLDMCLSFAKTTKRIDQQLADLKANRDSLDRDARAAWKEANDACHVLTNAVRVQCGVEPLPKAEPSEPTEHPPGARSEVELLTEIRDLLKARTA